MQNIKLLGISLIVASLLLTGCGSSDDTTTSTTTSTTEIGTFVDAPVEGLYYQTATQSGYTDTNGSFKYITGETIEFKLGTLALGEGTATTLITPYTISDNNDTATNIALLLQNFDRNRSNTNVLDLSKLKDYNFTTSDFNLSADPMIVQAKIETMFAENNFVQYRDETNNSILSASDVKNAMDNYISELTISTNLENSTISVATGFTKDWLNGRTLWTVITDPAPTRLVEISFTDTTLTISNLDLTRTLNYTYTLDESGVIHWIDSQDGPQQWSVIAVEDNIVYVPAETDIDEGINPAQTLPLYLNQTDAQNTIDSILSIENGFTESWLENRTLYLVVLDTEDDNNNGQTNDYMIVSWKFENNQMLWYFDGVYNSTLNYTLENGVLGFTTSDGDWEKYTITDVNNLNVGQLTTNVEVSWDNVTEDETIYITKEAADTKLAELQANNTISVETGFTREWLNGKTLWIVYLDEDNNNVKKMLQATFENNQVTYYLEDGTTQQDSYTLIDGILSIGTDDYQGIKVINGDQIDICQDSSLTTIQNYCAQQVSDPWYFTTEEAATNFLNN